MSRNFEEVELDEAARQRSRFVPVEVPAPARPVWNWEELNAKFRPRLVAAGVIRFGLTQDDCEDAVQTVFLKVLAMNPRVRDPKAYLRAAFLNQCKHVLEARTTRSGRQTAISDQLAEVLPDAAAERARTVSAMSGAYRLVDPQCGQVIASYCVEDITLAQAADRSGYAPKIVWKRIQESLKRMRACLAS
jgi:DNA-directed RNA polymerase specialized sigma24 family protein